MAEHPVKVKQDTEHDQEDSSWLSEQIERAARNLLEKPLERRSPIRISDDDINQKFRIR